MFDDEDDDEPVAVAVPPAKAPVKAAPTATAAAKKPNLLDDDDDDDGLKSKDVKIIYDHQFYRSVWIFKTEASCSCKSRCRRRYVALLKPHKLFS